MSIWIIFGLIGGLAVFLYGMLVMNENITQSAGQKLRQVLLTMTGSKLKGYMTGLGITVLNQASSATTVLEAAFVGAGLMTFHQSLAVTLGSELGSTITAQLVAFKITKFALLIMAVGFYASLFSKSKKAKSICGAIIGFGLLFLGMDIMSQSLEPLRSYEPFLRMMATIEQPILGILFGMFFTMVVQSSGATSGITVAMAMSGTITLAQAVPINLGASIGTCITAVLGSMPLNREAKRVAYIHIMFQALGVLTVFLLMCIPYGADNLWLVFVRSATNKITGGASLAREIAMAHTFMPILNHIIVIPTLPFWVKVFNKIYPPRETEKPFGPVHINDGLLDTPAVALEQAKKEILRVVDIVDDMFKDSLQVFKTRDMKLAEKVSLTDIRVDVLRAALVPYLTKLGQQNLSEDESKTEIAYLFIVHELEAVGDIIDKGIMPLARKMVNTECCFSDEGFREVTELHGRVRKNLENVLKAYVEGDIVLAGEVAASKPEIGMMETEFRMKHIERLHQGLKQSIQSSSIHFDLIGQYKRINSHITSMAYIVKGQIEAPEKA